MPSSSFFASPQNSPTTGRAEPHSVLTRNNSQLLASLTSSQEGITVSPFTSPNLFQRFSSPLALNSAQSSSRRASISRQSSGNRLSPTALNLSNDLRMHLKRIYPTLIDKMKECNITDLGIYYPETASKIKMPFRDFMVVCFILDSEPLFAYPLASEFIGFMQDSLSEYRCWVGTNLDLAIEVDHIFTEELDSLKPPVQHFIDGMVTITDFINSEENKTVNLAASSPKPKI